MTLHDRIKLIDDMIRENRDASILDYLETLKDMERVEITQAQEEHVTSLADAGLLYRSHDKLIRTPAERYELPPTELKRNSA